jgi:phytoene dehydrogenase-like protein
MTTDKYDGLLIGGGHNSLILQAYAGRAGLSTLCLEGRPFAGGGLTTEELPAGTGFLHNTHSFYHRAITQMPWYVDLELERRGARYIHPDLNVAVLTKEGQCLKWWTDFERTRASVAGFSQHDADTLQRWRDDFRPILRDILIPESQSPPLPPEERTRQLSQSPSGRLLLEVSQSSPLDFVSREFEHPVVQAGLLFFNGLREVDLRVAGFGHHIPALLASDTLAQICEGGSRSLAAALVDAVRVNHGEVITGVRPRRILVEQGRAVGVECEDGNIIQARRFVASSLNPHQTFLELIEEQHVPLEWRQQASNYEYNVIAPLFGLYLNLSQPLHYQLAETCPEIDDALMVILGLQCPEQFTNMVTHHEHGTVGAPIMWGSSPTRFDPSQAPVDRHTAFIWEKVPYALHGQGQRWEEERQAHARRMFDAWCRFAPSLRDSVIDQFARTPLDTERELPNMRYGDLLVGSLARGQVGYHRPFPGAGHYRGHLPGLYLCGSSCHPGGNITGLPGYNCAQVLLADLGVPLPNDSEKL